MDTARHDGPGDDGTGSAEPAALLRGAVWSLIALALVLVLYPLIRAFFDFEIDYNEGWNAYFQRRAVAGEPLYAGYGPLFTNNYPPLPFYLIGALGWVTGDVVLAGRLLSLAALVAIALGCGAAVRAAGGRTWEQGFAAATCLLLFASFATDYLGMNDPQLFAQALATWALAVHLGGAPSARRALATVALLALSLLTKHNLVLIPLLVTADVLRRGTAGSRRAYVGGGLILAALTLIALWLLFGTELFARLLSPRTWEVDRAFLFTIESLGTYQAPLAVVGLGLWAARRQPPSGLILVYLLLAIALGALWSGGAGTDINVFFDIPIALAIGAGLVLIELRRRGITPRLQAAFVLAANAGVLFYAPQALGRFGVDLAGEMAQRQRLFREDAAWLDAQAGPVLCQSQLLCLRAGKPMGVDAFNTTQAILTGRLPPDTLTGPIAARRFAVVQISDLPQRSPDDPPGAQTRPARFVNFADDVFAALDRSYRIERVGISGRFYVPE
jgi:4-amino-4-deoxy-L-arabinose transferase-like glycosyltransferase